MERTIQTNPEGALAGGCGDEFPVPDAKSLWIAQAGAPSREKVPVESSQRLTSGPWEVRGLTGQRGYTQVIAATQQDMDP